MNENPKYIQLTADAPNGTWALKKGAIFTLSKRWKTSEDEPEYYYGVNRPHRSASFATHNLVDAKEYWEEITREEIDKLKIDATEEQLTMYSYSGGPWKGIWIEQPYRHFIYDENEN